jgi:hypothetical protein
MQLVKWRCSRQAWCHAYTYSSTTPLVTPSCSSVRYMQNAVLHGLLYNGPTPANLHQASTWWAHIGFLEMDTGMHMHSDQWIPGYQDIL